MKYGIKHLCAKYFCNNCEQLLPEGGSWLEEGNPLPGDVEYHFRYCPYCGEELDWEVIEDRFKEYWDLPDRENYDDENPWFATRPISKRKAEENLGKRAGEGNKKYGIEVYC